MKAVSSESERATGRMKSGIPYGIPNIPCDRLSWRHHFLSNHQEHDQSSTSLPETPLRKVIRHELQAIRGKWLWLLGLGIALIVLGTILLGSPVIATLATVTALGA